LKKFEYNLYPFKTIFTYIIDYDSKNKTPFIINIIGNLIVLIPFGFLLPIAFPKQLDRLDKLLFASIIGISLIELLQLVFKLGVFDIDDIILNSVGVLIGFLILKVVQQTNIDK
jgi:glycopeptide antibiotics resistance protein